MPAKSRKKKPLVVTVLSILQVVGWILWSAVWLFLIIIWNDKPIPWSDTPDWVIFQIPLWAKWLVWVFWLLCGVCLFFYLKWLKEAKLEQAGYGIKALKSTTKKTDRSIIADIVRVRTFAPGGPSGFGQHVEVPWTRLRVRHTSKIPCVIEVVKGKTKRMRFFENGAYMEWKRHQEDQRTVPKKVKIERLKVATAYPREMNPAVMDKAERVFDAQDIAQVEGIIRIEPDQVFFLEEGDMLEGEYLRMVGNLLVRLAEKTEKEFGTRG